MHSRFPKARRFNFAVLDGYGLVWGSLIAAFTWPFYTDLDALERTRRQSCNQALQPTADQPAEGMKDE
jgi:hypothetical protein